MKKFNLRLFLAVLSVLALNVSTSTAQAKFGLETAQKVGKTIKIEQTEYEVWKTAKTGAEFIRLQSTHGNEYTLFTGIITNEIYLDKPVRKTKTGKRFIIKISKNNNPYIYYIK